MNASATAPVRGLAARLVLLAAIFAAPVWLAASAHAQTTPTPTDTPAPMVTVTPTPDASAAPSPTPETPSPSASPSDTSVGQTLDLVSRSAAYLEGKASRDEVFSAIMGSLATVRGELDKAGIKPAGHAIAVFLEADDNGFTYRSEIPIEAIPEGKTQLSASVKFGQTPVGRAMRFEHRGSYDDIDATYEAITAYLDEKGIDAQDVFMEEYLNDVKTSDDPNLQVDIYVLLK